VSSIFRASSILSQFKNNSKRIINFLIFFARIFLFLCKYAIIDNVKYLC